MTRGVQVEVVPLSDAVEGVWCGPCALPSAFALMYLLLFEGRIVNVALGQVCGECDVEVYV